VFAWLNIVLGGIVIVTDIIMTNDV